MIYLVGKSQPPRGYSIWEVFQFQIFQFFSFLNTVIFIVGRAGFTIGSHTPNAVCRPEAGETASTVSFFMPEIGWQAVRFGRGNLITVGAHRHIFLFWGSTLFGRAALLGRGFRQNHKYLIVYFGSHDLVEWAGESAAPFFRFFTLICRLFHNFGEKPFFPSDLSDLRMISCMPSSARSSWHVRDSTARFFVFMSDQFRCPFHFSFSVRNFGWKKINKCYKSIRSQSINTSFVVLTHICFF